MLGSFQQTALRVEVTATAPHIREALTQTAKLKQWLAPIQLSSDLPPELTAGLTYTSSLGPISVQHHVDYLNGSCLRLILSQGIDGFHEWMWGDDWVQSRLEGVSLLPINLAQTASLLRLRQFLKKQP
jgi:hypothetical protein